MYPLGSGGGGVVSRGGKGGPWGGGGGEKNGGGGGGGNDIDKDNDCDGNDKDNDHNPPATLRGPEAAKSGLTSKVRMSARTWFELKSF